MILQDEYQVRLDAFCGPLDLLLYLIRQAEVDVHDIPIARVTDQYLEFLRQVEDIDIEAAGEFLVMAATLIEIKSRTIMPPSSVPAGEPGEVEESLDALGTDPSDEASGGGGGGGDPRYELVRQLLQYQRFRIAGEALEEGRHDFQRRFPFRPARGPAPGGDGHRAGPPELEIEDAHVFDLYESYRQISLAVDFSRLGDHHVRMDETPAAVYQTRLMERLERAGGRLTLQEAFQEVDRLERLGLFLAMLELVRLRRMSVSQEDLLAEIRIVLLPRDASLGAPFGAPQDAPPESGPQPLEATPAPPA